MLPLKEATAAKHKIAEQMPFNQRMFRGEMNKHDYLLYLQQQLAVFSGMEEAGLPHPALNRFDKVRQDIEEIEKTGVQAEGVLPVTKEYVEYLKGLSDEDRLPHVYLNYLAVMFGGQMMKKVVPSSGKMYEFDDMPGAMQAVRRVQKDEWADEVNRGFDYSIKMFAELEEHSKVS